MSVNSYLKNLASELVLSESEKNHVATSVDTIEDRLDIYFESEVTEKNVFGSYERGTILPRRADEDSDVDIMVVFGSNPHGHKPQTFLNKLKAFAEYNYRTSEIYQSSPTIVLELNHIKFELTPSYLLYGTYYIPNGQSDWMTTDPDGFSINLMECNKSNDYKIKPIIRLLKYWNIQKNSRDMKSYKLEEEIADGLMYSYYSCSSYTDYLKAGFKEIKNNTDYSNVNTAIDYVDKAICYEEHGMSETALSEIKKVFPEI